MDRWQTNSLILAFLSTNHQSGTTTTASASSAAAVKEQAGKLAAIVPFVIIKPSVDGDWCYLLFIAILVRSRFLILSANVDRQAFTDKEWGFAELGQEYEWDT